MFADIELKINRPQDALIAVRGKIISDVKTRYEDASIELLHQSYKTLLETLANTEIKIGQFKEKSIMIENERAEYLKTWNSFTKQLQTLCNKYKVDLPNVTVPQATGRGFAIQILNSAPTLATYDSKRIPTSLDTSKLDDLEEKLFEIKISLEISKSYRLQKAEMLREILSDA